MADPSEKDYAVSSVRIFVWGCECKLWGGRDGDECPECWDSPCHHYYSRATAEAFADECWDGKATCRECGQPPTVREFLEENAAHNLARLAAVREEGRRGGLAWAHANASDYEGRGKITAELRAITKEK